MDIKPARSYDEQIARLITFHKLELKNKEEARQILEKVNYYRLSSYGIGLKKADNKEQYRKGVSLDVLYQLHCFDSDLKHILIKVLEEIEIEFKTHMAYILSMKYGPIGYLEADNFSKIKKSDGTSVFETIISHLNAEIHRQRNRLFVKHHLKKYSRLSRILSTTIPRISKDVETSIIKRLLDRTSNKPLLILTFCNVQRSFCMKSG